MNTIEVDENTQTATICGYDAELIELLADKAGKNSEDFILSFFDGRCNAPRLTRFFNSRAGLNNSYSHEVQCT